MGESKRKRLRQEEALQRSAGLQTVGGKIYVRWESESVNQRANLTRQPG